MVYTRGLRYVFIDLIFTVNFPDRYILKFNVSRLLKLTAQQLKITTKAEIKMLITLLMHLHSTVLKSKICFSQLQPVSLSTLSLVPRTFPSCNSTSSQEHPSSFLTGPASFLLVPAASSLKSKQAISPPKGFVCHSYSS